MNLRNSARNCFVAPFTLVALVAAHPLAFAQTATTSTVVINRNLPADAPRVVVALTANSSTDMQGGSSQSRNIASETVPERFRTYGDGQYNYYFVLGPDLAKREYHLLARLREDLKFLGHSGSSNAPLEVLVLRQPEVESQQLEEVTSGILSSGNSFNVPFRYTFPQPLGINGVRDTHGAMSISIHSRNEDRFSGSVNLQSGLSLSGNNFLQGGKLGVTLNAITQVPPPPDQSIQVTLESTDPNAPNRTANQKMSELLTLGPAKLVVESITQDLSQLTLAVVHGDLDAAATQQAETVTALPSLAQVELFDRRVLSSSDLLTSAAKSGWLVLIFGEFKPEASGGYPYPGGGRMTPNLSMSTQAIMQTLSQASPSGSLPTTAFVVRSVDLSMLYADYLNSRPEFLVLSDFADPMQVQFRAPNPYGGFHGPSPSTSAAPGLRQILNLPEGRVSVALFDATGKARYVKAEVGENLQSALLEVVNIMKQGQAAPAGQ